MTVFPRLIQACPTAEGCVQGDPLTHLLKTLQTTITVLMDACSSNRWPISGGAPEPPSLYSPVPLSPPIPAPLMQGSDLLARLLNALRNHHHCTALYR